MAISCRVTFALCSHLIAAMVNAVFNIHKNQRVITHVQSDTYQDNE